MHYDVSFDGTNETKSKRVAPANEVRRLNQGLKLLLRIRLCVCPQNSYPYLFQVGSGAVGPAAP